jgi:hypothetical protein
MFVVTRLSDSRTNKGRKQTNDCTYSEVSSNGWPDLLGAASRRLNAR